MTPDEQNNKSEFDKDTIKQKEEAKKKDEDSKKTGTQDNLQANLPKEKKWLANLTTGLLALGGVGEVAVSGWLGPILKFYQLVKRYIIGKGTKETNTARRLVEIGSLFLIAFYIIFSLTFIIMIGYVYIYPFKNIEILIDIIKEMI